MKTLSDRLPAILVAVLLVAAALLGGASRANEWSQWLMRIVAVAVLVAALWSPQTIRLVRYRPLLVFAGLCLALGVLQLVPLPPGLWEILPGRGFYADIARQVGLTPTWRPISLTPELTLHAVLALVVPGAMLVAMASTPAARLWRPALLIVAIGFVSLLLGYAQIAGGPQSALRFYSVTNRDAMVGLFANRNHHAMLLAMMIPILFAFAAGFRTDDTWRRLGPPLCAIAGLLVAGTLLAAGSRAGLLLGAAGALAGATLLMTMAPVTRSRRAIREMPTGWRGWLAQPRRLILPGVVLLIAVLAVAFAQAPAMQRLLHADPAEELRAQLFPAMLEMAMALMPFGGGLGSFDQLFRRFEPLGQLRTTYQNQAHMEPLQVVIESGLPGLALMLLFLWWWGRSTLAAWRAPRPADLAQALPRLGSIVTGLALLGSAGDYPLRTPLHAVIFVIGCVWLAIGHRAFETRPGMRRPR